MSQRGHGSDSPGRGADDEEAQEEPGAERSLLSTGSRPIAPYDPYRPPTGELRRTVSRQFEPYERPPRRPTRSGDEETFLPDDDPLNAEAWQLELDEVPGEDEEGEALLPDLEHEYMPPARRSRRPAATRGNRQAATASRQSRKRRAASESGVRDRIPRGGVTLTVPQAVAGSPLVADQTALLLLGLNAASFIIMTLVLGLRVGGLPSPTVLHLDAAGNPDRWGSPSVLWRLPVMSLAIAVMALAIAWFLHPLDRFAARFALGAAVLAQAIAWVAVLQHVA
jgi:hypothetical protein